MRDIDAAPRKVLQMFGGPPKKWGSSDSGSGSGGGKGAARPDRSTFAALKAIPGESMKSFARRVNLERSNGLGQVRSGAGPAKTINDKRKRYLNEKKARKQAKKRGEAPSQETWDDEEEQRGQQQQSQQQGGSRGNGGGGGQNGGAKRQRTAENGASAASFQPPAANSGGSRSKRPDATDQFPTETIRFGERAMEPPRGLPEPRKSQVRGRSVMHAREPAHPIATVSLPLPPTHPNFSKRAEAAPAGGDPQGAEGGQASAHARQRSSRDRCRSRGSAACCPQVAGP